MISYFPNLSGLRCLAATMVFFSHIEQQRSYFSFENRFDTVQNGLLGSIGVEIFFVLSGFLISYLLFGEYKANNTVNIKNFYIKRVLRIWPLYYLVLLLAFVLLPHIGLFQVPQLTAQFQNSPRIIAVFLFIVILPNLASKFTLPIPFTTQLWSIGSEEQFYLFWPVFIKRIKDNFLKTCLILIFIYTGSVTLLNVFKADFLSLSKNENVRQGVDALIQFYASLRLTSFCIGAIAAYLYFHKNSILRFATNRYVEVCAWTLLVVSLIIGIKWSFFNSEYYAIIAIFIILNASTNPKSIVHFENRILIHLGNISYGLYMLHNICIVCMINLLTQAGLDLNTVGGAISLILSSYLLTILISSFSFRYFESFFQGFRKRLLS